MIPIWIGIDDTDSTKGGCSTFVALALIKKLLENNYDIIGHPRLVRLNPNIPWKTRGNGAISLQVSKGYREKIKIGQIEDKEIYAYKQSSDDYEKSDYLEIKNYVKDIVEKYAKMEDENTNPGFVILQKKPDFKQYIKGVQEIVLIDDTKSLLTSMEADYEGYKNMRGLIGATAATAWSPLNDRTYELIAYRKKEKWGTKRKIDIESVKKMDETCENTFDNYDYKNKHNRITPNSPCPILYGIRGDNIEDLTHAISIIESETVDSWLIFETNQGTDDHLQKKKINMIKPYDSVITEGNIIKKPHTIVGGHVIFTIKDSTGEIDCAAYEPTKQFRKIIRKLVEGDIVEVYGGVREKPLTVNLEKIDVKNLIKVFEKIENPVCPKCGKHMKSKGKKQGYRCIRCGETQDEPVIEEKKRMIKTGFYEVPVCARRHLSKPLKRIKQTQTILAS